MHILKREKVWVADFKMEFCGMLERNNGAEHNNIIIDHQHNNNSNNITLFIIINYNIGRHRPIFLISAETAAAETAAAESKQQARTIN